MKDRSIPTLQDYGHDAISDFVRDISDEEREEVLQELYRRQVRQKNELDIGESKYIQNGGARIFRESADEYRIEFLSPTQELRRDIKRAFRRISGR